MFVGYARDTDAEVYRFLHLSTKKIITSRDVSWLGVSYDRYMRRKNSDTDEESLDPEGSTLEEALEDGVENETIDAQEETPMQAEQSGNRRIHTRSQGPPPPVQIGDTADPRVAKEIRRLDIATVDTSGREVEEHDDRPEQQEQQNDEPQQGVDQASSMLEQLLSLIHI